MKRRGKVLSSITEKDIDLLFSIAKQPKTIAELAEELKVAHNNCWLRVKKLRERNLIKSEIQQIKPRGRTSVIYITGEGREEIKGKLPNLKSLDIRMINKHIIKIDKELETYILTQNNKTVTQALKKAPIAEDETTWFLSVMNELYLKDKIELVIKKK